MKLGWSAASFVTAASLGILAIRPDVFSSLSLNPVSVGQNGHLSLRHLSPLSGSRYVLKHPKIDGRLNEVRKQRQQVNEIFGQLGYVQELKYPSFQEWYSPPLHCLEAKGTETITQCIAHKATAWRDFDELWMEGKMPPGAWEADIGILARIRTVPLRW